MAVHLRGKVSIHYETRGRGFPLLLLPPGGLNATISFWNRSTFNPVEIFETDFRVIALDQRNAGESTGPLDPEDPWGMYAEDQIALMNHLGIERFHVLGCCIGGPFILKLIERAGPRVVSAVLQKPMGIDDDNRDELRDYWKPWVRDIAAKRADLDLATLEAFGRQMWSGEFAMTVSKDFIRSCETPMLVLPGGDHHHPRSIGLGIAELAPNAELLDNWAEPNSMPHTVARIREFLKEHTPS
jgi:pimeloyl-ACP methyl ester carboxylesterase